MTDTLGRDAVNRAFGKLREVGVRYTVRLAVERLVSADWFRAGSLVVLAVDPKPNQSLACAPDEGEELRWATREDVELLGRFGHSRSTLEDRLSRGDRAFVMQCDRELVGYVWFRTGVYDEEGLGIRFQMPQDEAWLYDAMIAHAHRGWGLYPSLLNAAAAALGNDGVARIWVAVDPLNTTSLAAHIRGGARRLHTFKLLRIVGMSWLVGASLLEVPHWYLFRWPEIPSSALRRISGESGAAST